MATVNERDLKNYRQEISEVLRQLPPRLEAALRSFNLNKKETTQPAVTTTSNDPAQELRIYRRISQGMQEGIDEQAMAELLRLRSVLAFINGVAAPIDQLTELVNQKIDKKRLFCDACVRDINELFRKTQFLTVACADAVLTGSPILKAHVICGSDHLLGEIGYPPDSSNSRDKCDCAHKAHELHEKMRAQFHTILTRIKEIANHIPGPMLLESWACPAPAARFHRADGKQEIS